MYVRGMRPDGFIYLEHLWRTAGLRKRQLRPETALSSCLALKGQQHINQSEDKGRRCVEAADLSNGAHYISVA